MNYRLEVIKSEQYCYINAYVDGNSERIGKLGIEYKGDKKAKIIYVFTSPRYTNKGVATAMLNKAIEEFSDYELTLNIVPMPREGERITVRDLNDFYEKFGFRRTDDICLPTMIRKPSLPTLGE